MHKKSSNKTKVNMQQFEIHYVNQKTNDLKHSHRSVCCDSEKIIIEKKQKATFEYFFSKSYYILTWFFADTF